MPQYMRLACTVKASCNLLSVPMPVSNVSERVMAVRADGGVSSQLTTHVFVMPDGGVDKPHSTKHPKLPGCGMLTCTLDRSVHVAVAVTD